MRLTIQRAATASVSILVSVFAHVHVNQNQVANGQTLVPGLADVAFHRLFLSSLNGKDNRHVHTPWPVDSFTWSPDGRDIAFQGKRGIGVVALHGGRSTVVFDRRVKNFGEPLIWSPNSRHLLFTVDTPNLSVVNLWLWDRTTRKARLLARRASPVASWAHDSTRISLSIGGIISSDTQPNPRAEILNVRTGSTVQLGRGVPGSWSPDDRFIGFDRLLACGATGCFVSEGIMPSSGGHITVLDRNIRGGWLTDEEWVPRPHGYAYDRWLLGRRGHVIRRIPGRYDRVESWSPNGRWVAVRTITKTQRLVLTLIAVDTGRARRVFTSSQTGGCDACIHQQYQLSWNHSSTAFVMLTPYVAGGPKDVDPILYSYTLKPRQGWRLSRGHRLHHPYPALLGWVDQDRGAIVYSGRELYRFIPAHNRLAPILVGVPYSKSNIDPMYGSTVELRPGS